MPDTARIKKRIYLDNAATSWPKPSEVTSEIMRYYTELGVAAGRGNSASAVEVDRTIATCRSEIAKLVDCAPDHVAFCFNGTDALHLALNGLIESGDEVVTTCVEHNSVLRPLRQLQDSKEIQLHIVPAIEGVVDLEAMAKAITTTTKLVCISHASNVTGRLQPIESIARLCHQNSALLVVDAAQTVGHLQVDMSQLNCDVLVASGHKGLMGPLGTGFIALSNRAATAIRPTRLGGTGTQSETLVQPDALPFRLESGNLNVGGIFGLLAGVQFVNNTGLDVISRHEQTLRKQIVDGLSALESVSIYASPQSDGLSTGVVSFNIDNQDCHTVAAMLDSAFGIYVRAGLHCAPLIHESIGSGKLGGTVRISPGTFTTYEQINFLLEALESLTTQWV